MAIKTFQFMAENASPWYDRLDVKEKAKLNSAVSKMNSGLNHVKRYGLPKQYVGAGAKMAKRHNANPSNLTDEAIFALDNVISRTVEDQNIFGQVMAEVTTSLSTPKWTGKAYKIDELDVNSTKAWPHADQTFRNPETFKIGIEPEGFKGMGFSTSYEIPWTEIAESKGSIYSPDFYYALVAAERMGIIIDEAGWLGGAGQHMNVDYNYKGLINHASIQSCSVSTPSTFGNLRLGLFNALGDLKTCFQAGKNVGVCTSGFASQFYYNRVTYTDVSEYERTMAELRRWIPEMWVTDRLYGAAASASQQILALFKVGATTMTNKIVYPLQTKPMQNKTYSDDIKEALIYGNIFGIYGNSPFPVTVATGLNTDDTGFIPNGRLW